METTFNKQQTALFLADNATGYAPGQQDEIALIDSLTTDEIRTQLTDLNDQADNAETLFGTWPDNTVIEIGTAPRRPIPPTA